MPRLVKPDRSGKPRILESRGGKPVIVEYGIGLCRSTESRVIPKDIIIPVINTNENHLQLDIFNAPKFSLALLCTCNIRHHITQICSELFVSAFIHLLFYSPNFNNVFNLSVECFIYFTRLSVALLHSINGRETAKDLKEGAMT
jgi:hypothetical protein